jgi:acetyl esterase
MSKIDDPEVLAFIARTEAAYPADANIATPAENRRHYDAMCAVFRQPRPAGMIVEDADVDGIPVRRYLPAQVRHNAPEVLYVHGGGFVVGSLESHDDVCAEIADYARIKVTSVDYRLAPEHVAPAQLDDVETVWRHLSERNARLIAVGDSAGGNLCAGLSVRMRRLGGPMPISQVLIYPGLGGDLSWPSYSENAEAPLLRTSDILAYRKHNAAAHRLSDAEIEEASPLQAKSFAGQPPTFVFTADVDPLRDDGEQFVKRLSEAGVHAEWRNDLQLVHGYLRGRVMSKRIGGAFEAICACIAKFSDDAATSRQVA